MITVVTITYNNFNELLDTLKSIEGLPNIEIVVINGGQCAKTRNFLENYPCFAINEPDRGIADAFNKGIQLSSGEAIVFLNSGDVLIVPDYYEKAQQLLDSNNDIAYVHSDIVFNDSQVGELLFRPKFRNIGAGIPFFHQSLIIKKYVFNEIGLFDLSYKYAMDYDFMVRILGYEGVYIPAATVKMDGDGISINREAESISECYRSLKSHRLLSLNVFSSFLIRCIKFQLRRLLILVGGRRALLNFKSQKYV